MKTFFIVVGGILFSGVLLVGACLDIWQGIQTGDTPLLGAFIIAWFIIAAVKAFEKPLTPTQKENIDRAVRALMEQKQ